MPWKTEHPPVQAELDQCIQCGLCLPSCPTFRLTGLETASPRGRLTAMSAVASGMEIDADFETMMGTCLQCRACEVVCPAFVPFGKTMEAARAELAVQRPSGWRRLRRWAVARALPSRRWMRVASRGAWLVQRTNAFGVVPAKLRGGLRGLRRLNDRSASIVGTHVAGRGAHGVAAVLAGCVMDVWFGEVHRATIDLLTAAGYEVVVPAAQTCCGALAAHDGWSDEARAMAARNVAAFAEADVIVANAAGCGAHLRDYAHWDPNGTSLAARTRDVTEVVAEAIDDGRLPTMDPSGVTVGVQDPCHLRHAQRVVAEPRRVLEAAGHDIVEIDPSGSCCGAAGLYGILEPEMSGQLGEAKAEQVRRSGATVVASANPGCEMQLRSSLGQGYRVAHPVELYHEVLSAAGAL